MLSYWDWDGFIKQSFESQPMPAVKLNVKAKVR